MIRSDGIEVIATGLTSGRTTVAAADLAQALIELPVAAWPYGSVVAMSELGLRAADLTDGKLTPRSRDEAVIAENLKAALATLEALDVTVERWSS